MGVFWGAVINSYKRLAGRGKHRLWSAARGVGAAAAGSGGGARLEHDLRLLEDAEQAPLLGRHARLPDQGTEREIFNL
jgi:hypothetical protein